MFGAVFAAATQLHHPFVRYSFEFLTWFLLFQYFTLYRQSRKLQINSDTTTIDKLMESYRNGEHLPTWLDNVIYLCLALVLAGYTHWVLAICWVIIGGIDILLHEKACKK